MAGNFLNFRISDEEREAIDAAAAKTGIDRSKQARALIRFALGIEEQPKMPYIPIARPEGLRFSSPTHETPSKKSRKPGRKAA